MTQTRSAMQIDSGKPAGSARETIGHAQHDRFLQTQHVLQFRELRNGFHDGQFSGTGIAKQVANTLVDQELQKCVATGRSAGSHVRPCTLTCRATSSPTAAVTRLTTKASKLPPRGNPALPA